MSFTVQQSCALVAEQLRAPFRGEIWEFYEDVPMGRGFANQGQPFDIDSAWYLKPVMAAIRSRPYGKYIIQSAVQMLKTNGTIEQPAGYFIVNDPGDMVIYLLGDDSAFDQAKARLMPFIKALPDIARIIEDVTSASSSGRFDITTAEFYLPGMVLRIWPLNETTTQRLTLRYVFISDAFLSKKTGLLQQAIARTTQHNTSKARDYKIVIESQGGEAGDDFDQEWKTTDMRLLTVVCPECGMRQVFEWHRARADDFVATITKAKKEEILTAENAENAKGEEMDGRAVVPRSPNIGENGENIGAATQHRPTDIETAQSELTALLKSSGRRHAGMKRGQEELIKREDSTLDEQAVMKGTYYECYHCGSAWHDTPAVRYSLDHSSDYEAQNLTALPENIGFSWPAWAGQRLSWGMIMLEYLRAKEAMKQGNPLPLQIWYQKRAARPWDADLLRPTIEIAPGSYDPNKVMPDEYSRNMMVDAQQDQDVMDKTGKSVTGWFWYDASVIDKFGNSRQLARGFCKSWDALFKVQKFWKIPNDRVAIDINHWPDQIMMQVAGHVEMITNEKWKLHPFQIKERPVTWYLFSGTDENRFPHRDKKIRTWSEPQAVMVTVIDPDGKPKRVTLKKIRWSNLAFGQQLEAILSGAPGLPRIEVLGREHLDPLTLEMEVGDRTYERQIGAEQLVNKRGKDKFEKMRPHNHYRDLRTMHLVRQAMDGMLGHLAVAVPGEGAE